MFYSVKITSEDGEFVEIGNDNSETSAITDVEIKLDTINNEVKEKAMGMLAKIKIKGVILDSSDNPDSKQKYIDLFNWAKSLSKEKWYRTVEIKIYTDENREEVYRKYQFEKVFVVDYFEKYSSSTSKDSKGDTFELYLTQKENNFKSIDSY